MNRLRNRLILVFPAATLAPFGAGLWVAASLIERSLAYSSTAELDEISKSLETTGRELYQRARRELKEKAASGRLEPQRYTEGDRSNWPAAVAAFWSSGEPKRFVLSGSEGDRLDLLVRRGREVWLYSADLGPVSMERLSQQYRQARELVDAARSRDLRRGFLYTYLLLAASLWAISLLILIVLANRISRPIQKLTKGLSQLAAGDLGARVDTSRDDEIGRAIQAFNHMAGQLQENRERLVYLTQLASWQALARKMAHEAKNSLTPIRLTMEEMLARHDRDRAFLEQAAQIVIDEVESLERRVRAFSEFAAEPPVRPAPLDVNALVAERIAFLQTGHPEARYEARLAANAPRAFADEDLVKGILTNLLENAAEAAGAGGRILAVTAAADGSVAIEVHDSGPGLSEESRRSLFQPTISFKERGMGLGLSIARKSALLSGGDILLIRGELGGAGFRVLLPAATDACQARSDHR